MHDTGHYASMYIYIKREIEKLTKWHWSILFIEYLW